MNSSNISHNSIIKQDAMVGYYMKKGFSLPRLIENLIREYGVYNQNNISFDVNTISISDKRLLISHFESAEWYAYACESIEKTNAIFAESADHIQNLINQECYPVYIDIMEEMRAYK